MNYNHFKEVIDELILRDTKLSDEFKDKVKDLPLYQKREAILLAIDGDRMLYTKLSKILFDKNLSKMEILKQCILMLREYVKVGEVDKDRYGEVMTPLELVKDILRILPNSDYSNPHLKFLDPSNGTGAFPLIIIYKLMEGLKEYEPDEELRYKHIIENMIYASELQPVNMFLWLTLIVPFDEYKCNIYTGSFLDEGFDNHMREIWKIDKFDIIVANPPYLKNTHLRFLEKASSISDKALFIHPSPWIFRKESLLKNDINRVKSIRLLNGNYWFKNEQFNSPLSITYINNVKDNNIIITYTDGETFDIKTNEIPSGFWKPTKEIFTLIDKYKKLASIDNLFNYLSIIKGEYIITIPTACGHIVNRNDEIEYRNDDFYTLFYRNSNLDRKDTPNKVLNVNTEKEREYLIEYMKTKIARFGLAINKISQHIHISRYLETIPIPPLNKKYTEIELLKLFNISEVEYEIIDQLIKDYY